MKKILILIIMALIAFMPLSGAVNLTRLTSSEILIEPKTYNNGFTNITVHEAYEILTSTSDGIQIPIDVRTDEEWNNERINTPPPENPVHWPDLQHGVGLQEFMEEYADKEVVIYCRSGNRSFIATELLIDNGFTGTIYQMVGGIKEWKAEGYPTRPPKAKSNTLSVLYPVSRDLLEKFPNLFPMLQTLLQQLGLQ